MEHSWVMFAIATSGILYMVGMRKSIEYQYFVLNQIKMHNIDTPIYWL